MLAQQMYNKARKLQKNIVSSILKKIWAKFNRWYNKSKLENMCKLVKD